MPVPLITILELGVVLEEIVRPDDRPGHVERLERVFDGHLGGEVRHVQEVFGPEDRVVNDVLETVLPGQIIRRSGPG